MKLLIRGGSIAAGFGVKKCYADILEESLLKKGIAVINRSRYRETSFDGIGTFDEDIDNRFLLERNKSLSFSNMHDFE